MHYVAHIWEEDGVGSARVVDDGGDREQALEINILNWDLTNDVRIGMNNSWKREIVTKNRSWVRISLALSSNFMTTMTIV